MTYPNELTSPNPQSGWPTRFNEALKSLRGPALYAPNDLTTTGLTEGGFGGEYGATTIADWTVTLTNTTTNYIVAHRTTGAVTTSTATTNWNDTTTYGRVRRCVTAGGVTTARIDWRFLEGGIFDRTSAGAAVATDTIWDAAGDLVQGTGADTAARLPIGTALQVLRVNSGATAVEWAAATGNVATDAIWDAAGDLVQGTGANTGAKLPIGTAGQVLKVNGGATAVEWGTSAGDVATDAIWDAAGDLVYGTGANTGARLAPGTARQKLRMNSGATAPEWVADKQCIAVACSDELTALTAGTAKITFRMPYAFTLSEVRASVTTAPTGGTLLTVDINEAGASILSTKLTFDASEKTTTTAATPAVISDTTLADDAEMTVDIDTVGSTIAGAGLKVYLIGVPT